MQATTEWKRGHIWDILHCFESTVTTITTRGRGGTVVRTAEPHCQNLLAWGLGLSFPFLSLIGEGGTAISFATRLHGLCNASHNRMEEGAHLGHLSYRPAPELWTGDKCPPPLFPSFVWKGTAVLYQP